MAYHGCLSMLLQSRTTWLQQLADHSPPTSRFRRREPARMLGSNSLPASALQRSQTIPNRYRCARLASSWMPPAAPAPLALWRRQRCRVRRCRSAYRNNNHPDNRNNHVGFRVCCLPQHPSPSEPLEGIPAGAHEGSRPAPVISHRQHGTGCSAQRRVGRFV